MTCYKASNSEVFTKLFAPVVDVYPDSEKQYDCAVLSDLDFLEMGLLRTISESRSGRDFVQRHGDHQRKDLDYDLFFKSLKSQRRINNLSSVNQLLKKVVASHVTDPFASIPELEKFVILGGDGHFHEGAVHDEKYVTRNGIEKKPSTGHFFLMDFRSQYMSHIQTADVDGTRRHEHDIRAMKRSSFDQLRGHAPKGTKVILVWDRASYDSAFWHKAKHSFGLYFLSRAKENMNFEPIKDLEFDRSDLRNSGVISDQKVETPAKNIDLRRIEYRDPVSGKVYVYITTEMTLPPGIVCLLYKQRWDIEKIFDEFKNKLDEKKSWGSGKKTKTSNALFLCLAHNLLLILESLLNEQGITNDGEIERRAKRFEEAVKKGANYVATHVQRLTVIDLKFIRWLRNFVYGELSWSVATERLRSIYAKF